MLFSWELNIPKLSVVEEVGGTNFHGFIFLWAREDEIFEDFSNWVTIMMNECKNLSKPR